MAANVPGYEEVEEPEILGDDKEGMGNELTIETPGVSSPA